MNCRRVSSILLVAIVCLIADLPNADGQIFRRLRQRLQPAAPATRYQPQYRPQTPAKTNSPSANQAAGNNGAARSPNSPVIRIDPRTGAAVLVQPSKTGRPIQVRPAQTSRPIPSSGKAIASPVPVERQPGSEATPRDTDTRSDATPTAEKRFGNSVLQTNQVNAAASRPSGATLGLRVAPSGNPTPGLSVLSFKENSRADESGLRVGDRILFFDGQRTSDIQSLTKLLADTTPGQVATLRIGRGSLIGDVRVPLVENKLASAKRPTESIAGSTANSAVVAPPMPKAAGKDPVKDKGVRLGVDIEDRDGTRGVIIVSVDPDSPAKAAGLEPGDRIVSVDGRMVVDTDALARELSMRSDQTPMAVQLVRKNQLRSSTIRFDVAAVEPTSVPDADAKSPNDDGPESPGQTRSVLSGVGSMFGGIFGAKAADPKQETAAKKPEIEQPVAQPEPEQPSVAQPAVLQSGEVTPAAGLDDEMAFGDDEPINQAVFNEPIGVNEIPERVLEGEVPGQPRQPSAKPDPPSAAKITPPAKSIEMELIPPAQPDPKSTNRKIQELEAEVERLKSLLDQSSQ